MGTTALEGTEAWAVALDHIGNGVLVVDEDETVRLVSPKALTIFKIPSDAIAVGHSLGDYLACIGREVGWPPERVVAVHTNHRAWKQAGVAKQIRHHFDDGTVLRVGYHPRPGAGAVLTYDDITHEVRLAEMMRARDEGAASFRADIHSTVDTVALAARETRSTQEDVTGSLRKTSTHIAELAVAAEQSATAMRDAASTNGEITRIFDALVTDVDGVAGETRTALAEAAVGQEAFSRLTARAETAGSILDRIHGIASESRLLALNARIEAARAGDAGRGFGVVAQAVKSLADQTMEAASRTERELADIRQAIAAALAANQATEAAVRTISRHAEAVRANTADQQQRVIAVAAAIDETAVATGAMSDNVRQIDCQLRDLVLGVGRITGRLCEMDQQVETLVAGADRFRRLHLDQEPRLAS